ncbi:MAG: DUF350 domain-containing protein [Fibrobacterales bacterium]
MNIQLIIEQLTDLTDLSFLIHSEAPLYLLLAVVILALGKFAFNITVPFALDHQLTTEDNKAIALSFAGYLFALMLIIIGVFSTETTREVNVYQDILMTLIWGVAGIILLNLARYMNDKILLRKFSTNKELVNDRNVGTGAVEFGCLVGVGFIIKAVVSGESESIGYDIFGTVLYSILGQAIFFLYGELYQLITPYDLHAEIEKDNASAGVAFGFNLIAVGILTGAGITYTDSLIVLIAWVVLSMFLLITVRYMIDKVMLPGCLMNREISEDHNWGSAIIEGVLLIGFSVLLIKLAL